MDVTIPAEARASAKIALDAFCLDHSSPDGGDRLRYIYEFETNAALLLKQKPGFLNDDTWVSQAVARFRYSEARDSWSLYWPDANGRWHRVTNVKAEKDIQTLLQVVISDPLGVFWS